MTTEMPGETDTPDTVASEMADGDESPVAAAIAAAEEITDPLDGLTDRVADDPGAPFAPEVLEGLSAMKKEDRAAFELLRSKLKKAGCHVTALDEAIMQKNGDGGRRPTQADILIDLAGTAELFHTADGTAFADLDINGHRETWPVRTKGFKRWLARQFYETTDGAPSSEALQSALNVVEAKAHFDAPERPVYIRVGGIDGSLYLDLGDEAWRAIEITTTGWRVVENPPVRFRRAAGMQPLPVPVQGGSVEVLRSFLNVQSDTDFVLVVAWALAVLRNRGPYPVIVLSGEQGSAKSTFSAILRSLLDPNTAPLRALPRENRDLFIAASNGHVLAFDNVSGLPSWTSDTLCRLATGGGFAVRQLYTDQDEVLFDATRPVILNGIEDIVTRPDLADRAVFLTLEAIPEERRRLRGGIVGRVRRRAPRHSGRAARRGGSGPEDAPRYNVGTATAHGGFRAVGDSLRDGVMARRHFLVGLLQQPRRGGRERDRGRPGRCRCPRGDGGAGGVDGNGDGSSGRPCGGSRGTRRQVEDLAGQPSGIVRSPASGRDLPSQDRHRDRLRKGRPAAHKGHFHHGEGEFQRPGLSRAATVRTVRIVREPTERQWNQRIRGKQQADGWRACGR